MNLPRYVPCVALCLLGFAPLVQAHATPFSTTGNFIADDSVYSYDFTLTGTENITAFTTSYATGGFDPALTLFSDASGNVVAYDDPADSDATLAATLAAGSYVLDLSEFPNVAVGTLSQGFLFAGDPTVTGSNCGVSGGMFLDPITCAQLTSNYALTVNAVSATPEPSTWLLVLPGAVGVYYASRRRRIA